MAGPTLITGNQMAGNVPSSGIPGRRCWTVPLPSGRGVGKALSGSPVCDLRLQHTLRSRYAFCVMSLMAQGAHRGRPVAAAPCTPGLRPAKSPLRGAFDFSLQASGRAEAASLQNTALSPHPCGLPRPSGNVSAMLRPPTLAVSATMLNTLKAGRTDRRPDKAQPPSGTRIYSPRADFTSPQIHSW